ncbi:MAG TPA: Xaa-Pro peptidase family protein [Chloroflexota bacterium]
MAVATNIRPTISLKERDRRYAAIRAQMKERGVDAAIVTGTNLFYLTNELPGERFGLLTAEGSAFVLLNPRHLADISAQVLIDAQDWVKDIAPGDGPEPFVQRLEALKLANGTVGITRGFSFEFRRALTSGLPNAKIVDVTDLFLDLRTIKSDEEIAMIEYANQVFDAAVERVHEVAHVGMTGAQVIQEGVKAMWEAGGDLDSTFGFSFGAVPAQNPILGWMSHDRVIQRGDVGTLTAHAEYLHYAGHSDQEIVFGNPKALHQDIFKAVIEVRDLVLKAVKPGVTQQDLIDVYREACKGTGFRSSPHSQIHQYGIDVPEFPGPGFVLKSEQATGRAAVMGSRGNFALKAGMIYSISPTLIAADSEDTLLGGTSLVVTEDGYRNLGDRKVELLVNPA